MKDERRGRPSASTMARTAACPGWLREAAKAPPAPETEEAKLGTKLHAYIANEPCQPLTEEEHQLIRPMMRGLDHAYTVAGIYGQPGVTIKECRLWHQASNWSGKPDEVTVLPVDHVALVVDFKTGWGDVDEADSNMQLRALAVLVWMHYHCDEVYAAIVTPHSTQPGVARYDDDDLVTASEQIYDIVAKSDLPNAPLVAGDHCQYCPAALAMTCPVYVAQSTMAVDAVVPPAVTKKEVSDKVARLPKHDLEFLLARRNVMKWLLDSMDAEAKRRLESGDDNAPEGWMLKTTGSTSSITDITTVAQRLIQRGIDPEAIVRACTITKGNLEDLLRWNCSLSGTELKHAVNDVLAGCVETKMKAPALKRVTK